MLEFFEKLLVKHWDGTRFLKFLEEMPLFISNASCCHVLQE